MRIGITGISGFLGASLAAHIRTSRPGWTVTGAAREVFSSESERERFVRGSDVIFHFAAVSRHADGEFLYRTNMLLAQQIFDAVAAAPDRKVLLLASTTHEKNLPYHRSKREAERLFSSLTGDKRGGALLMPNVFGPGGKPFYNSVTATFCQQIMTGEEPKILLDGTMELIDIHSLSETLCRIAENAWDFSRDFPGGFRIPAPFRCTVSELLASLRALFNGKKPENDWEKLLRETLFSYASSSSPGK